MLEERAGSFIIDDPTFRNQDSGIFE